MTEVPSTKAAVFSPEAVASINKAYLDACEALSAQGYLASLRSKLAEHMMYLARNGETDEHRLCRLSLVAVLGHAPQAARP